MKPIRFKDEYVKAIRERLEYYFYTLIFKDLFDFLSVEIKNAKTTALNEALSEGQVRYVDGYFVGKFSAKISSEIVKIGGKYNKVVKGYKLTPGKIPQDIMASVAQGEIKAESVKKGVFDILDQTEKNTQSLTYQMDLSKELDKIAADVDDQFIKAVPGEIGIKATITKGIKENLIESYNTNMNLSIKDWTEKAVERLREKVQKNVYSGMRADKLQKVLMSEYDVTRKKAEFLARQETSLMVSKYREERYKSAGIQKYRWSSSQDSRVRDRHRKLNGRIFSWDNPPIVDEETGRRAHPGEDFNCLPEDSNIDFAYGIKKAFRRWYAGELTTIITDSGKTLRATPNHQVFTLTGWKAIGSLDDGDYIIKLEDDLINPFGNEIDDSKPMIGKIFNSLRHNFTMLTAHSTREDFHGDGSVDGQVNIINTARSLRIAGEFIFFHRFKDCFFASPNSFTSRLRAFSKKCFNIFFAIFRMEIFPFMRCSGSLSYFLKLFFCGVFKTNDVGLRPASYFNTSIEQPTADNNSFNACSFGNRQLAFSRDISRYNRIRIKSKEIMRSSSFPSIGICANGSEMFRKIISCKSDNLGSFIKRHPGVKKLDRVIQVSTENFSGHVYNLETINNWYCSNGIIIHNCRCVSIPII